MISLFMDRQSEREFSLKKCSLQKLAKSQMSIFLVYNEEINNQEYFYWMIESINNANFIEFHIGMGIINNLEIVGNLENAIKYNAKFTLPTNIEEKIYPLYLFQNRDEHKTECYDYIVRSRVDITFLVYEDAFQIRWGTSEIVRYYRLNDFVLMGLTQKDELVSITLLQDIRKYIEMNHDQFGDCLDVDIYPHSENQEMDDVVIQCKYQQIIHPKLPAYLFESFLLGLDEISIFDKVGNELEIFFNINFRGDKFTLHQDFDLWMVSAFDDKVNQSNFQALVDYLEKNNNRKFKNFYLTIKDRLFFWH